MNLHLNLSDCSDYETVLNRAQHYYGNNTILLLSTRPTKKYMIFNPHRNNFEHFGAMEYFDYTKYRQLFDLKTADKHRNRYLKRALNIKGEWRNNPYSANYLSVLLLWDFKPRIDHRQLI